MGKQMVVYVVGMSLLVGYALLNLNRTGLNSQDTSSVYFGKTMVHNIALAGANIGTHLCLNDTAYNTSLTNQPFNGGYYDVQVTKAGDSTVVKSFARMSMRYYDAYALQPGWKNEIRDTIQSTLKKIYFSRYAYFSDDENFNYLTPSSNTVPSPGITQNVWKITGDSILGPAHTNGQWNFNGSPYFGQKVTGGNSPNLAGFGSPKYNGGYQWGVTINRPTSRLNEIEAAASSAGKLWTGTITGNQDIRLTFASNGNVRLRIPWNSGSTKDTTYASITAVAPNGIMGVKGIDVRIDGVYNGRATVFARKGSASTKGNVWFQGDIVAADNPQTNPNSDDMLGVVAERMAYVATTGITRNASSQTNIQAAIYTQDGVFAVENYNSVPAIGRLNLYGGTVGKAANVIGTFSGGSIVSGMIRSYRYDSRFLSQTPPGYPSSDKLQLVAWWEN